MSEKIHEKGARGKAVAPGQKPAWHPFPASWREDFITSLGEQNIEIERLFDEDVLPTCDLLKVAKGAMMFLLNPKLLADERRIRHKTLANKVANNLRRQAREIDARIPKGPLVFRDFEGFFGSTVSRDLHERERIRERLDLIEKVFDSKTSGIYENHYYLFAVSEYLKSKWGSSPTAVELAAVVIAANRALGRRSLDPGSTDPDGGIQRLDPDSLIRKLHRFEQNRPWLRAVEELRLQAIEIIEHLPA